MTNTRRPVRLYSTPTAIMRTPTMCKVEAACGGIPAIAISVTQKARMEQKKSQNCKTYKEK
jgi:broad specificity polyphosphatase/5'/3'-nucleotidase SurE